MIQKKQVLIVEDNELNRSMLSEILSSEYRVLEAENGQEALDILQQHKDSVSLILLDVMMPVMDGYTFLNRIKSDEELSLIPVIVMTQSDNEMDEVAALTHGATDFVPKPYRPQVILHRAASLIKLRETAAMVNQFQYDRLTGLYSKEFFCQKVKERLLEDPEQDYCIVCSNIENFKLVNDIFGTQEGDRILQETASITQKMVGSTGFCGRFTADRFLCFQKRELEQQDRMNFGNFEGQEPSAALKSVVMRWGIYEITDRTIPVEQMCDRALLAVDSIKGQYNQFFAVYDDSLRHKMLREKAVINAIEAALSADQFVIYYQPKYSINDEYMAGAEALVRWIHPEWGFMSPGEFIPLFEKNGCISRLDQYVWEKVCTKLRDWKEAGYKLLPVSVNVSRADVYQLDLVDVLVGLTKKYGVDPKYLHLEITESTYAENPNHIISTVDQLREQGFVVEMDDFGSGYSSLNMLSQIELDILKLDMKFIQHELEKPVERSILNDIISMAHRLYLGVVAEGVETREQMERLQAVGCDFVQGYFLAKPMPLSEFEELLKTQPIKPETTAARMRRKEDDKGSLLVVEENEAYRKKIRETFEGRYQILEASDVDSAIARLRSHGRNGVYAVILSMTIPNDGAASLMKALRQDPAFWRIPVMATIPQCNVSEELPMTLETDDFLCKCHPMIDFHKRVDRLVGEMSCQSRECSLRDEANRDYMTGLLNRRGLQAALASMRKEELPFAICLFDLDNLKTVNDTLGHSAGDRMIRSFAELLRSMTRSDDILCRYGGDEFMVILKHISDESHAKRKCEDICSGFHDRIASEGDEFSCSAGIALCNQDKRYFNQWIEYADRALYRAKREKKGSCCMWKE